jgi:DivIVA domain-containing protein
VTVARKKNNEQSGLEEAGSFQPARLRPIDVQQVEFRVSRKGYNETEVDAFLDRVTEELNTLAEENKRLREGGLVAGLGAPEASAEAQVIIRDARAEAAAILAAAAGGAGTGGGDPLGAVYPFLTKERDFLSRLGEMVREHMEGIKTDARVLQEAGKAAAAAASTQVEAPPAAVELPAAEPAPAAEPEAVLGDEVEPAPSEDEPTLASVWEETAAPAGATAGPAAAEEVASIPPSEVDTPKKETGEEPSLRDLFWGDE